MDPIDSHRVAEAVISTPELLEAILQNVDMVTLLVSAQRVSRYWLNVVTASTAIPRILFFAPVPAPKAEDSVQEEDREAHGPPRHSFDVRDGDKTGSRHNPLLVKFFGYVFDHCKGHRRYFRRANAFARLPWSPAPIAAAARAEKLGEWLSDEEEPYEDTTSEEKAARRRFTRSGASWRRMLVSQPPPPFLGYLWLESTYENLSKSTAFLKPHELRPKSPVGPGLRMGELYDFVQYRAGHHERNSVYFRVVWDRSLPPFPYGTLGIEAMLSQANVITEFYHLSDQDSRRREPTDADVFDGVFRCDDFCHAEVWKCSSTLTNGRIDEIIMGFCSLSTASEPFILALEEISVIS